MNYSVAIPRRCDPAVSGRCLLLLLLALLGGAGCQRQSAAPPVRNPTIPVTAVPVRLVPLDRTLALVGTLFPKDDATVGAEVEGRVERTWVEFGDRITNRQELARIDTTSYLAQADVARANTAKARAALLQTEQELGRIRLLRKEGIGTPSDLDKAVADEQGARAELQATEARAALAELAVERSRARAPFDAAVAERLASAGDYVKVGSPLFRIVTHKLCSPAGQRSPSCLYHHMCYC